MIRFYTKNQIWTKIGRSIVRYVLFLVIVNLAVIWGINRKTLPKPIQKFNVFVSALVNGDLKKDLRNKLDKSIYEDNVYTFDLNDKYYGSYYSLYGPGESDIVITPKQEDNTIINNFLPLDLSKDKGLIVDNTLYGIEVYNSEAQSSLLEKYLKTPIDSTLYAFISRKSVHASDSSNLAFEIMENIFYEN